MGFNTPATTQTFTTTGGKIAVARSDEEGNQSVQINGPLTAFGELEIAELTPITQMSFVHGYNSYLMITGSFNGGSVTFATSSLILQTGASAGGTSYFFTKNM